MSTPFKLKSGNTPLYKKLGSSPLKQDKKTGTKETSWKDLPHIITPAGDTLTSSRSAYGKYYDMSRTEEQKTTHVLGKLKRHLPVLQYLHKHGGSDSKESYAKKTKEIKDRIGIIEKQTQKK